ncbi:hypothetical protein L6452_18474 [Arctium lappa]|uniref:Uncharacterized protein n=1 Tax=Arctium lappa TaxID=4217 RepID=A0ACB9C6F9_ARCLA|nr:hypothetical protein L6452_18474 [Arctium lappa]
MATLLQILLLVLPIISSPTTIAAGYLPPSMPEEQDQAPPPYNLSTLLYTLGFHDLSVAASSSTINTANVTTIFSPTDVSLRSCPYCSLPLLLLEHSIPGLYPFRLLSNLAFGTKIETLASTPTTALCLTLTKSTPANSSIDPTLFVGGVEITRPDLFNDGTFIIHGIQGFLAHLSPVSCQIERMTSLSFPSQQQPAPSPPSVVMRSLLKDAMIRLRMSDYTVLALLIQENLDQLLQLNSMTIFSVDDAGVFGDGHTYVSNLRFHIVPNLRLMALGLMNLPSGSVLPTMEPGETLVVTVAGGEGLLSPMRINNVKVTSTNIVFNEGVVVHGIATPFPRVHRTTMGFWPDQTEMINLGPTATADT